jgi:hypothetical protein
VTGLDPQPVVDIVSAVACPTSRPPSRKLTEKLLKDSDPEFVFWLAVEHVMELPYALQRAGVRRSEPAAQEPVTVGPELAEKVRQRAERDAAGRCCPRSVGELSPTCCQYCSQGCS